MAERHKRKADYVQVVFAPHERDGKAVTDARHYRGYPINALISVDLGPVEIASGDGKNFTFPSHKPQSKFGPPPLTIRALTWEADSPGLTLQVFEAGTLKKGVWGDHSVDLYPLMIPLGTSGGWELAPDLSVRLVDKDAHGRICLVNQTYATIRVKSLIVWCSPLAEKR